jgi:hypothetical protein
MDWKESLGRPVSATDQPPGTYRYRARRGAPFQAVKIMLSDDGFWDVLLNGSPVARSGQLDPMDIPFVLNRGPFAPISEHEYRALILEFEMAADGSPLKTPDEPVNLRRSAPL